MHAHELASRRRCALHQSEHLCFASGEVSTSEEPRASVDTKIPLTHTQLCGSNRRCRGTERRRRASTATATRVKCKQCENERRIYRVMCEPKLHGLPLAPNSEQLLDGPIPLRAVTVVGLNCFYINVAPAEALDRARARIVGQLH